MLFTPQWRTRRRSWAGLPWWRWSARKGVGTISSAPERFHGWTRQPYDVRDQYLGVAKAILFLSGRGVLADPDKQTVAHVQQVNILNRITDRHRSTTRLNLIINKKQLLANNYGKWFYWRLEVVNVNSAGFHFWHFAGTCLVRNSTIAHVS